MHKSIFQTFFTRFLLVFLNFGLVVFTTNMWGSEGKGIISLVIADLALVSFFSNIFVAGSTTFFSAKYGRQHLLAYAYLWAVAVGILAPILYSLVHPQKYLLMLIALTVSSALLSANISLFVGERNFRMVNLYTVLQTAVQFVLIFAMVFIFRKASVGTYFVSQIITCGVLFLVSAFSLLRVERFSGFKFSRKIFAEMWDYGWKSQLSAFLSFLNYRLSFYFLEFLLGVPSVGVYSVGVAISEAVWMVSRSISLVLYSEAVNSSEQDYLLQRTKTSMKISLWITLLCLVAIVIFPSGFYTLVFGKDFHQTKQIILLLSPGILAMAVNNVASHYFAGVNQLRILNVKAIFGLATMGLLSLLLIPRFGIAGTCVATALSYCSSTAVLLWGFYQNTDFKLSDFTFTREEINMLMRKLGNDTIQI